MSRPEFKSSRKLKRGLSFNDFIILVIDLLLGNLEYQWPLCPALGSSKDCHFGWRSKRPAWKDVRIWLCSGIRFNSRPFSQSLQPVCLYTFSMSYINNWQNWLHRLMETSSKAVESSWDRQIASIYLTLKIQDLKYRSKHVPMRERINKQNRNKVTVANYWQLLEAKGGLI